MLASRLSLGREWAALPLSLALLVAACGVAPGFPSGGGRIEHPGGAALVLRVDHRGGLLPPDARFTSVPAFTLLGDGRVIVSGPVIAIYPGPALPNLQVRRLSEAGIQAVLAKVTATGLFAASRQFRGVSTVADAPDTIFSLRAGGRELTVTIYALGMGTGPGVDATEADAQRVLGELNGWLTSLDTALPAGAWTDARWQPYEPTALRLLIRNADAAPSPPSGGLGNERPWPASSDPATIGAPQPGDPGARCAVVIGGALSPWLTALRDANQLTRWRSGERAYAVAPRPVLPDEPPACPATS